jgi:hypothetical protein
MFRESLFFVGGKLTNRDACPEPRLDAMQLIGLTEVFLWSNTP